MVGSCPKCQRPFFVGEGQPAPTNCKGCGSSLMVDTEADAGRGVDLTEAVPTDFSSQREREAAQSIGRVVLGIGVVATVVNLAMAVDTFRFSQSAQKVTGRVSGVEQWQSKKNTKDILQIEYQAAGQKRLVRLSDSSLTPKSGDLIPLLVSASDPEDARLTTGLWSNRIGVGVIGLVLVAGGLMMTRRMLPGT